MNFIDVFAGVGGFRLGLERNGFNCVWTCEIDKYCNQVYKYHWGEVDATDIRLVKPEEIPDFDILCGGFPCQDFSIAGKRKGIEGCRGTLFYEIARIAEAKRPPYLFLENVKGLLSSRNGWDFAVILSTLDELGYDCQWQVLNSKHFGVPQNRERVFIIGHIRGRPRPKVFPIGKSHQDSDNTDGKEPSVSTPPITCQGGKNCRGLFITRTDHSKPYKESETVPPIRQTDKNEILIISKSGNEKKKSIFSTLSGGGHSGGDHSDMDLLLNQNNMKIRRLTPLECERLQGFPDSFTAEGIDIDGNEVIISASQRYKMMGNAITVNVIEAIGRKLMDASIQPAANGGD